MTTLPKIKQQNQTLFIYAYRGYSMRYILCTDIIKVLQEKISRIVIFVRDEDAEYFSKLYSGQNIIIEPVHFREARKQITRNALVTSLRLLRTFTSGRNDTLINYTDNLNKIQFKKEWSVGWGKYIFKLACFASFFTSRSITLRKLISLSNKLLLSGKIYDPYFEKYKPNALLIASIGYGIDDLMMSSARRNNCTIISIPYSWDNSSTEGYRGGTPDLVITWTPRMKKEIEVFHDIPESSVIVGGVAHWDSYFNKSYRPNNKLKFFEGKSLDPNKALLLYTLSAPRHLKHRFKIINMMLDVISSGHILSDAQLLVRFHPSDLYQRPDGTLAIEDNNDDIKYLESTYGNLVKFWVPNSPHMDGDGQLSMKDMYEMADAINHSDIIIQEYSTLIMETAVFDKPVINVSMHDWEQNLPITSSFGTRTHLRHILSFDSCITVESQNEFCDAANTYLENPAFKHRNRMNLLDTDLNTHRGNAGLKIGQIITDYIAYNNN